MLPFLLLFLVFIFIGFFAYGFIQAENQSKKIEKPNDKPLMETGERTIVVDLDLSKIGTATKEDKRQWRKEEQDFVNNEIKHREDLARATSVNGKHYVEWAARIQELKREKRHKEAIDLLLMCIEATEREADLMGEGWGVASGLYHNLAIIYRKEKDLEKEVEILERFKARMEKYNKAYDRNKTSKLFERLEKLKEKHAIS